MNVTNPNDHTNQATLSGAMNPIRTEGFYLLS